MNNIPISDIFRIIDDGGALSGSQVMRLLACSGEDMAALCEKADAVRAENMGDEVYFRGIIEFSNFCAKNCNYCGIRNSNNDAERYRMTGDEILEVSKEIERSGQTTVVLQSGEDPYYSREIMGDIISAIKKNTGLAVTLSIGNRTFDTYAFWKEKGMDRYLLRFETSNERLFRECHPDDDLENRVGCIKSLQKLGVQTGSGFLIGIPGETKEDLRDDILFCTSLDLDMIGIGPFIPHDGTPFAGTNNPFDLDIFVKVIAIIRLMNKKAHIPATTAYDAVLAGERDRLLRCGANVFMPNVTPAKYREHYMLYPGKPCVDEGVADSVSNVISRLKAMGRVAGTGPGHSMKR